MNPIFQVDPRHASLQLSRSYYEMGFMFRHYVKNERAAIACTPISYCYFFGLHRVAQLLHSYILRPLVRSDEWDLLIMYGKKHQII